MSDKTGGLQGSPPPSPGKQIRIFPPTGHILKALYRHSGWTIPDEKQYDHGRTVCDAPARYNTIYRMLQAGEQADCEQHLSITGIVNAVSSDVITTDT